MEPLLSRNLTSSLGSNDSPSLRRGITPNTPSDGNETPNQSGDEAQRRSKIPDGGWGWIVFVASIIILMISGGISYSFGLLYFGFFQQLEIKSKILLMSGLYIPLPLLSGTIGSALVDRCGCRIITIIGGFVSGIGFTVIAFVNTTELTYTFGFIAGLGLVLCNITTVVSIVYWFEDGRDFALFLLSCANGWGIIVYAPLTRYLIDTYCLQEATLILAGTVFTICVCGAVMRDPKWCIQEQNKSASLTGNKSIRRSSSCGSISGKSGIDDEFTEECPLETLADHTTVSSKGFTSDDVKHATPSRTVVSHSTVLRQKEKVSTYILH
jgi:hypothetical protein